MPKVSKVLTTFGLECYTIIGDFYIVRLDSKATTIKPFRQYKYSFVLKLQSLLPITEKVYRKMSSVLQQRVGVKTVRSRFNKEYQVRLGYPRLQSYTDYIATFTIDGLATRV